MTPLRSPILAICLIQLAACTVPRSVIESARVTPHKHVRAGLGSSYNIPTAFIGKSVTALKEGIESGIEDTLILDQQTINVMDAAVSYALDPLTTSTDLYLRYGLVPNLDVRYKWAGGVHTFDAQFQWMGSADHYPVITQEGLNGSFAVQYSGNKFKLPDYAGDVQELLGFEFKRKDVLFKFLFSQSLGEDEEEYGHLGFGFVYHRAFIRYDFNPIPIITMASGAGPAPAPLPDILEDLPGGSNSYGSLGTYLNFRVGYKHVFLYGSLAMYWQNYREYPLFAGHTFKAKGLTFIPSFGLQFEL